MDKSYLFSYYGKPLLNIKSPVKIAGFDLDWTIIKPKSGKVFPKDIYDWKFLYENIKTKLKYLFSNNYILVLITNQKNKNKNQLIKKLDDIFIKNLNIPFFILASLKDDKYRKPSIYLFLLFKKYLKLNNLVIDYKNSFYVGDAAGRIKNWKPKMRKDHSDSDRKFAFNCKLKFYTPEEFFLNEDTNMSWNWSGWSPTSKHPECILPKSAIGCPEMVIVMGYPSSGKSTFIKNNFEIFLSKQDNNLTTGFQNDRYFYFSGDKDGSRKLSKLVELNMIKGNSIIVEGLHSTKKSRCVWIKLSKQYGYYCRILFIDISIELAFQLNTCRSIKTGNKIPKVVYFKFRKNLEKPCYQEGWDKVENIIPKYNFKLINKYYF